MPTKTFFSLLLIISLATGVCAEARVARPAQRLESDKPIEREIAGGEAHTYQLDLAAGQFMRVVVEQRGVDVKLALAGPDGKPLVESDLTSIIGAPEPLSYEAPAAGTYQLVVRANGAATRSGAYVARLEVKASVSAQDRKRITAESLMESLVNEARRLFDQGLYADAKLSEKLGQALASFRDLEDRYLQALTLNLMGRAHNGSGQYEKAIEAFEQSLSLMRGEKLRAGEATLLRNIANVYRYLVRNDKVIELAEQALEISRAEKDRGGERSALTTLGIAYYETERFEKAIEFHEQSLAIGRELKTGEDSSSIWALPIGAWAVTRKRSNITSKRLPTLARRSCGHSNQFRSEI